MNGRTDAESAVDLTLVSDSLAGICSWQVLKETTVGSDHYPITTERDECRETGNWEL